MACVTLSGCANWAKPSQTVLDLTQIACVIANAESDDATVRRVCRIVDAVVPELEKLLSTTRAANRAYAATQKGQCQ